MRAASGAALLIAFAAAPAVARHAPPPDLGAITLDRADPVVDATIAGVPARLAVTFDLGLYLTAQTAARVPGDWVRGAHEQVGRVRIDHREATGDVVIAGVSAPMLLQTQDQPCCAGRDGAIAVTALPWSTVRIGDDGGRAERRYPLGIDDRSGLSVAWQVGGHTIHIVLDPAAPETVATAAAASLLARTYGGHLENAVRDVAVAYGVSRSVREMRLDTPADPLGFRIDRIAVRIGDFAGDTTLPAPPPEAVRPDDITVRHKPLPPQFGWAAITIGRDLLDRCPGLTFHRIGAGGGPEIALACDG